MRFSLLTVSCIAAMVLFSGCQKHQKPAENDAATKSVETPPSAIEPEYGTFSSVVTATASVEPSPDGIVSIVSPVNGTVQTVHVSVGDKVGSSAPLISIRSSDVSDVQSDLMAAKANVTQAKRVYDMNKELLRLGAITANDFALSESNLHQSEALLKGFEQKLNYMGASAGQTLTLRSPIPGVVYEVDTHLGEKVGTDQEKPLIQIANPHRKVIVATVYEKDIEAFVPGQKVHIIVQNHEEQPLSGTVDYVSDVLDAENRTTKVYIKPDADAAILKIHMFATIKADAQNKDVYRVPKKALLFKEGKFVVYVQQGNDFVPQNVTLINDDPSDDYSQIRGLAPHSKIALEPITLEQQ